MDLKVDGIGQGEFGVLRNAILDSKSLFLTCSNRTMRNDAYRSSSVVVDEEDIQQQ